MGNQLLQNVCLGQRFEILDPTCLPTNGHRTRKAMNISQLLPSHTPRSHWVEVQTDGQSGDGNGSVLRVQQVPRM